MSITQFFIVLRARWRSAALALLAVITLVTCGSLLLPARYTATASVVLDVKSPDPIGGTALQPAAVSAYMATQTDVLRSERVALRVIRSLRLEQDGELQNQWKDATQSNGEFQAWLADLMLKKLDVKPARESNVLTVAYTSPSPSLSAGIANAFVAAYIDTTLELRTEPAKQYNSFFDERARQLRDAVAQAQSKLSAYQQDNGIVALDEKLDVENSRLTELSSQLVTLQALADESASRQGQTGGNGDSMQEVLNNPLVAKLSEELSRQEARLNELSPRLGERHPQVLELQASIAQSSARLATEKRRVNASVGVNSSVNQARVRQVSSALDEQRTKVLRLKRQRDEAAVLQRDVENAQRAHDAMVTRVNDTSIESQNKQTNVSVLKRASPPAFRSSPKMLLNVAGAIVLGLLVGVGVALVRELLDPRLRTDGDVVSVLKQPLLGALPVRRSGQGIGHSRTRLIKARVLDALPHARRSLPNGPVGSTASS